MKYIKKQHIIINSASYKIFSKIFIYFFDNLLTTGEKYSKMFLGTIPKNIF